MVIFWRRQLACQHCIINLYMFDAFLSLKGSIFDKIIKNIVNFKGFCFYWLIIMLHTRTESLYTVRNQNAENLIFFKYHNDIGFKHYSNTFIFIYGLYHIPTLPIFHNVTHWRPPWPQGETGRYSRPWLWSLEHQSPLLLNGSL